MDIQEQEERDREMKRLNDRLRQLEDELSRSPRNGLAATPIGGFELTSSTVMFGLVVGLVVYIIMSGGNKVERRQIPWWEKY